MSHGHAVQQGLAGFGRRAVGTDAPETVEARKVRRILEAVIADTRRRQNEFAAGRTLCGGDPDEKRRARLPGADLARAVAARGAVVIAGHES
jgi:hypothetical protein